MPRAVVLPSLARAARQQRAQELRAGGDVFGGGPAEAPPAAPPDEDEFTARLVKYIPAEALTFFLTVSSWTDIPDGLLIALIAVGTVGAALWASNRNRKLPADVRQPTPRVLTLTVVAFLAWVVGTSGTVQDLFGVSQQVGVIVTTVVAFLLPAIDEAIALRGAES